MMAFDFVKMHGAGNDYVYVDCFRQRLEGDLAALAQRVSDRRFGVGSDGLILIHPSSAGDARMQMFNADGSESEMCGNGIRCVAKFLFDHGLVRRTTQTIETGAGILTLQLHAGGDGRIEQVTVDMGTPRLVAEQIPTTLAPAGQRIVEQPLALADHQLLVTCVSMGNPHCISFVEELSDELVLGLGPSIEQDRRFPRRTNVEFVKVLSRTEVKQRTWERGSGETWACGTGASAVCVAGVLTGRTERRIRNHLLGGTLELHWDEATDHVYMKGPAVEVFAGRWPD
jgi:diaminopimelate epimerase